jgi:hypothetical protein
MLSPCTRHQRPYQCRQIDKLHCFFGSLNSQQIELPCHSHLCALASNIVNVSARQEPRAGAMVGATGAGVIGAAMAQTVVGAPNAKPTCFPRNVLGMVT